LAGFFALETRWQRFGQFLNDYLQLGPMKILIFPMKILIVSMNLKILHFLYEKSE